MINPIKVEVIDNLKHNRAMSAAQVCKVGQTTLTDLQYSKFDDEANGDWSLIGDEVQ